LSGGTHEVSFQAEARNGERRSPKKRIKTTGKAKFKGEKLRSVAESGRGGGRLPHLSLDSPTKGKGGKDFSMSRGQCKKG